MKVPAYQKKYKLEETSKFNHEALVADLVEDLMTMVENAGRPNWDKFQNIIIDFRIKFNKIFIGTKITMEAADKLWSFFYATEIGPMRDRLFELPINVKIQNCLVIRWPEVGFVFEGTQLVIDGQNSGIYAAMAEPLKDQKLQRAAEDAVISTVLLSVEQYLRAAA